MHTSTLQAVIRGKKNWRELPAHGIDVRFYSGEWRFGPPAAELLKPTADDLIEGMRTLSNDSAAIKEWASFILAASNLIELDDLGHRSDKILETLWDLSGGEMESLADLLEEEGKP